jgi:hypothetical protein
MDSLVGLALTVEFDTNYFEGFPNTTTSLKDFPNYCDAPHNSDHRLTGEMHFAVFKNDGNWITEDLRLFKAH